jgi:hypothetical protein
MCGSDGGDRSRCDITWELTPLDCSGGGMRRCWRLAMQKALDQVTSPSPSIPCSSGRGNVGPRLTGERARRLRQNQTTADRL